MGVWLSLFLLFHMAIPLIPFEFSNVREKVRFNRFFLIIGSLFPDLIDKPLLFLKFSSGRGFAHSLLFVVFSFLVLHIISLRNGALSYSFLVGCLFHLALDLPGTPLFYPFVEYDYDMLENPVGYWYEVLWTNPLVLFTEIVGLIIIIGVIIKNQLFTITDSIEYLKTNQKGIKKNE